MTIETENEVIDNQDKELENEVQIENEETTETEEIAEGEAEPATAETESDTLSITIEGEESEEESKAPEWVKKVREQNRELTRRLREYEAQKQPESQLPPKPKLEDFDYDTDAHDAALDSWYQIKMEHDKKIEEKNKIEQEKQKQWIAKVETYEKAKTELKVLDYKDAEETIRDFLSEPQQSMILNVAKEPAKLVYALGKNPAKVKELANITDLGVFAYKLGELESKMKVTTNKTAPAPERTVTGGTGGVSSNARLDKLLETARRTGDYSAYYAAKSQSK